jgi:DNA repair exonuclease SbcCD nuclease subunit
MNNLIIGDLHLRIEEPFLSATSDFLSWLLSKEEYNNENTNLIFLGDIFHRSLPNPIVVKKFMEFINKSKVNEIHIIAGNHGYTRIRDSYAIYPLSTMEKVRIYTQPADIVLSDLGHCLMMPYLYEGMKETYENDFNINQYDYAFGHFADRALFGEEIDISKLQAKNIVLGHVHIGQPDKDNYLGVPVITNYAEKGYKPKLLSVKDGVKDYIDLPVFLDYFSIDYETKKIEKDYEANYKIFDIVNAPSIGQAKEKFEDIDYIRNITIKQPEESKALLESGETKTLLDFFKAYANSKKLPKRESEMILSIMGEQ